MGNVEPDDHLRHGEGRSAILPYNSASLKYLRCWTVWQFRSSESEWRSETDGVCQLESRVTLFTYIDEHKT